MTANLESILDESISALPAGVPIEEILAEAPDYASELRPLLYAAMLLADPKPELVPAERKAALHAEYMAQVAELPLVPPTFGDKVGAVFRIARRRLTRKAVINDLITVTITVVLTLAMAVLVLTYAAGDTLPGDFLYGVKRISEDVRLALTFSQEAKTALEDEFNRRRLDELEQLLQQNRAAAVEFRGILETKAKNLWIVNGLTILLSDDTHIKGDPQEGDMVEVAGLLRTNNVLVADTIKQIP